MPDLGKLTTGELTTTTGAGPFAEASPGEIRAALTGEETGQFDTAWREVLARAMETRDLSEMFAMLDRWRRVAWSTRDDPAASTEASSCSRDGQRTRPTCIATSTYV